MKNTSQTQEPQTLIEKIANRKSALTIREFAELFSLCPRTVRYMASQGRIPAMRVGGIWRLDPAQTAEWVRGQQVAANAN